MSTLISSKKKMGRPTIDSEAVNVRIERADLTQLDQWRAAQPDTPGRPEAVRRLMKKGLAGE